MALLKIVSIFFKKFKIYDHFDFFKIFMKFYKIVNMPSLPWQTYSKLHKLPQQKNQNFPIVLGWKFTGNGQVSVGNLRETENFHFPFGKLWENEFVSQKFPQQKNVLKFHYFFCSVPFKS